VKIRMPAWLCKRFGGHCCHPPPGVDDWGPCCRCGWFVRSRSVKDPNVVDGRSLTWKEFQDEYFRRPHPIGSYDLEALHMNRMYEEY